eukprot:5678676-Pyramimonas_sp.AAC.1
MVLSHEGNILGARARPLRVLPKARSERFRVLPLLRGTAFSAPLFLLLTRRDTLPQVEGLDVEMRFMVDPPPSVQDT